MTSLRAWVWGVLAGLLAAAVAVAWALARVLTPPPARPEEPARAGRSAEVVELREAHRELVEARAELDAARRLDDPDARSEALTALLRARQLRRQRAGWGALHGSLVVLVILGGLALLQGCARPTPPPVFATAPPVVGEPEPLPEWPEAGDACAGPAALIPGQPAPYVDEVGLATCRAQIVPEADAYACLWDERRANYYERIAHAQWAARLDDRVRCEEVATGRWQHGEDLRRHLAVQRWATTGALLGGTTLGLAIGVAVGLAVGGVGP